MRQPLGTIVTFVRRSPFLLLGVIALVLFLTDALEQSAPSPNAGSRIVHHGIRVLIAPLWLMRTLEVAIGMADYPPALHYGVALPLLLTPYALVDMLLRAILRSIPRRD